MIDGKKLPRPEHDPKLYADLEICPICRERVEDHHEYFQRFAGCDLPYSHLKYHIACWLFTRNNWRCRQCRRWFPNSVPRGPISERGVYCPGCYYEYFARVREERRARGC